MPGDRIDHGRQAGRVLADHAERVRPGLPAVSSPRAQGLRLASLTLALALAGCASVSGPAADGAGSSSAATGGSAAAAGSSSPATGGQAGQGASAQTGSKAASASGTAEKTGDTASAAGSDASERASGGAQSGGTDGNGHGSSGNGSSVTGGAAALAGGLGAALGGSSSSEGAASAESSSGSGVATKDVSSAASGASGAGDAASGAASAVGTDGAASAAAGAASDAASGAAGSALSAAGVPTSLDDVTGGVKLEHLTTYDPKDPLQAYNRVMFAFNEKADKYALKPVAKAYKTVTPDAVQFMLGNFFSNMYDLYTGANNLLQGKPKEVLQDVTRFVLNSTLGFLGFGDVATEMGLPKHNEDLGQTLGKWGVPSGPYFVLPLLGPSTVRDAAAKPVDSLYGSAYQWQDGHTALKWQLWTVEKINDRAKLLDAEKMLDDAALDRYTLIRDGWLARRKNAVYDGNPPDDDTDDADDPYADDPYADDPTQDEGAVDDAQGASSGDTTSGSDASKDAGADAAKDAAGDSAGAAKDAASGKADTVKDAARDKASAVKDAANDKAGKAKASAGKAAGAAKGKQ